MLFANILATEDMSELKTVQWCISSMSTGDNRECDLLPLSGAFAMNQSQPMVAGGGYPSITSWEPTHIGGDQCVLHTSVVHIAAQECVVCIVTHKCMLSIATHDAV